MRQDSGANPTDSSESSLQHPLRSRRPVVIEGLPSMSLATLPVSSRSAAPAPAPASAPAVAPRPAAPAAPKLQVVPDGTEARGFVLYVGVDEAKTAAAGTDLAA